MARIPSLSEAHASYPVAFGDVWRVGVHTVICGDIEAEAWLPALRRHALPAGAPALTYTDPPWGAALATGFRTKAGMPRRVVYDDFLRLLADRVAVVGSGGAAFVEQGRDWQAQTADAFTERGFVAVRALPAAITYYRRSPATLTAFMPAGAPGDARLLAQDALDACEGRDDADTPGVVLSRYPAGVVFDPCLGQGLTLIAAAATGHACVGVELNPRRMAVALARMAAIGHHPELIDTAGGQPA